MDDSFLLTTKQVADYFDVDPRFGLNKGQVAKFSEKYGKNSLPEDEKTPLWKMILEQFKDQLVIILMVAAVISFVLAFFEEKHPGAEEEHWLTAFVEPIVILLILIGNATVGVVQETNAEKAIEALKKYSPDEAKVLRDGHVHRIAAEDLLPGDIIEVAVGDKVPADCRLLEIMSSSFRVDQSILTGESVSVSKDVGPIKDKKAVKQDMINMIFSGTTISTGKARAIVVLTGANTAIGDIHNSIMNETDEKTPLKQKLDDFGDSLAKVISVVCIVVWLININHFNDPAHNGWFRGAVYYFKIAVALAVAAIPEGLAVVITTCLALGTKKMAAKNAIVRSLPSVETLGCTSVICSDKTGTLTTNQMSVQHVLLINDAAGAVEEYEVSGTSYAPIGDVVPAKEASVPGKMVKGTVTGNELIKELTHICTMCNESSVDYDAKTGNYLRVGEPTEVALRVLVEKIKTDDPEFNSSLDELDIAERTEACNGFIEKQYEKLATLEFSRDRKSMSVLVKKTGTKKSKFSSKDGGIIMYVKGAPESILERCAYVRLGNGSTVPIDAKLKKKISEYIDFYGLKKTLRCLALATKDETYSKFSDYDLREPANYVNYENDLTFVGLVGMSDPPRPEVRKSIETCKNAGIRVIVITGDNQNTAESVCKQIGIFDENESLKGKSYTGREWDQLSPERKKKAALEANLFSRTEPTHKSELVDVLQGLGFVVAMTGDGVNDAPALKKADIGVAMGSGTDVSKLAADMVLADDNFASIVSAVEEGRSIYNNTKQFIRYLISSNIGEVVSIFLTAALGMPEALIPVQLLWVNLVTDGFPATALGFNPPDHDIMNQPPRSKDEPIVGRWLLIRYLIVGTYVGAATVFGYAWWFMFYENGPKISFSHLTSFSKCDQLHGSINGYSCKALFGHDSLMMTKASTMSLSVLVVIEMFNALNSLSENESILSLTPFSNIYLIFAVVLSMSLHFLILYVPFFTKMFAITALNWDEWKGVLLISFPVIIIDEVLKMVSRTFFAHHANLHQVIHGGYEELSTEKTATPKASADSKTATPVKRRNSGRRKKAD